MRPSNCGLRPNDVPFVLLIGGATGTGKSTVAAKVAHCLEITRVTSTDSIRQTIRAFLPPETMPFIHRSSFEAGEASAVADTGDPALAGFLEQTRVVLVGVEAAVSRAVREGLSLIVEGVHLVPGMVPAPNDAASIVSCVLRIERESAHRRHFAMRDTMTAGRRPMKKYLDALGEIRRIQDYIVDCARRSGTPILDNTGTEATTQRVVDLVSCNLGLSRLDRNPP
jgi:2-phosphoglycerate kinase